MNYTKQAEDFLQAIRPLQNLTMIRELNALSSGEIAALCHLFFQKDGVNAGELTEAFQIGSSRTAAILNGLEKKGYIVRQTDPADKRGVLVFITDAGRQRASARQQEVIEHMAEFLESLGPADAENFLAILYRAIEKRKQEPVDR